jgi:hypothetical protein
MLDAFSEALLDILYGGKSSLPSGVRVGVMTFDKSIHFYNLNVRVSFRVTKYNIYSSLLWSKLK